MGLIRPCDSEEVSSPLCFFFKALISVPWRLFERNPQQGSIIGKCQVRILHSSGKIQPLENEQLPPNLLEFVVAKFQVMRQVRDGFGKKNMWH